MIKTKHRKISDEFVLEPTELTQKKQNYESIALSNQMPVVWHKAKDFYVFDREDNQWIDMTAGIFTSNAGHSNPLICEAIKEQVDKLMFSFLYNTEVRYEFIEKLLEVSPSHFEKVVLLSTVSEVTDIAIKLLKFWAKKNNRKHVITFRGSYHGRTLGSDFLCGNENSTDWSGMKDNTIHFADFPYEECEFDPSTLPDPKDIAAFFLETYQGWGAWLYPDKYIKDLYDYARKHDILVCFDEIQAGFYRMGTLYGYMTYGDYIKPDMICLGKGLSSSLPMSAILATKELIDVDKKAVVGGTHSGNPVCCAASKANVEFLTSDYFHKDFKERCDLFEDKSLDLLKFDSIANINARGMVTGIITKNTEIATAVVVKCIEKGVLPVCTFKNAIKLGHPLTISSDAIVEAFGVIEESIREVENEQNNS